MRQGVLLDARAGRGWAAGALGGMKAKIGNRAQDGPLGATR